MKKKFATFLKISIAIIYVFAFFNLSFHSTILTQKLKSEMSKSDTVLVMIKLDKFSPESITVTTNSSVTWLNKDLWHHTVTSDDGLFDSGFIKKGEKFSYKFTKKGTYNYHCNVHSKMLAKVVVQ